MYICVSGGSSDLTQESLHKSSGKCRRRMSCHEHTQVATHPNREVYTSLDTVSFRHLQDRLHSCSPERLSGLSRRQQLELARTSAKARGRFHKDRIDTRRMNSRDSPGLPPHG